MDFENFGLMGLWLEEELCTHVHFTPLIKSLFCSAKFLSASFRYVYILLSIQYGLLRSSNNINQGWTQGFLRGGHRTRAQPGISTQ